MVTSSNFKMDSKFNVERELKLFLRTKSIEQLQSTTRKQCRSYLEQKLNVSLAKQKQQIKSILVKYIQELIKSNPHCSPKSKNVSKSNASKSIKLIQNEQQNQKKKIVGHKRSFNGDNDNICSNPQQPPVKKVKLSYSDCINIDIQSLNVQSPNNQNYDNYEEIEQMTELIRAENDICKLNDTLNKKLINKKKSLKNKIINIDYDNIEHEALKNKLTKCEEELKKTKQSLKEYASMLQPKIIQSQKLRKENEILNQNIEILKHKYEEEIKTLKIRLKNETETVKDERFTLLRKDKYIQRINAKYDFVCNKYNIDKDNVVIDMANAKNIENIKNIKNKNYNKNKTKR